ncbi:MAG: hypothetical protein KJZ74_10510 [Gemmatimonadales bacterium]|nr:hypothetical protein [Gemmatimonadales bacterium]
MTHRAWIASREPAPHPRLALRIEHMLAARPELAGAPTTDAMLAAGTALLAGVVGAAGGAADAGRAQALDLLAADACVTWAFEAAADTPALLGAQARQAMRALARVVA